MDANKKEPDSEPGEQDKDTEVVETVRILKLEEDLVPDDGGGADPYNAGRNNNEN
jgi:hypothetical protein